MKNWLMRRFLPWLAVRIITLLITTMRVRIHDPRGFMPAPSDGPVLFAFWHNRLLLMPYFYQRFMPQRHGMALVSTSRDGQAIADICALFGVRAARGSSSKKAMTAFRQLVRGVRQESSDIVITPDGPRGPRCQIQPGVLQLSQITQRPIIPATFHARHKIELRSWDGFQIPLPFTDCDLIIGEPMQVPATANEEEIAACGRQLQRTLGI